MYVLEKSNALPTLTDGKNMRPYGVLIGVGEGVKAGFAPGLVVAGSS